MPAATLRRISMKALARFQVILLGEQRHIRCEQLAQGDRASTGQTGRGFLATSQLLFCAKYAGGQD